MTIVITKISNSSNLNLLDDGWPSKLWADAQIVKLGGSLIRLAVAAFMTREKSKTIIHTLRIIWDTRNERKERRWQDNVLNTSLAEDGAFITSKDY